MAIERMDRPSRRGLLVAGAATAAVVSSGLGGEALAAPAIPKKVTDQIQQIIQAQGMTSNGVFSIEIDRNDITNVMLKGVAILPAFQLNGTLYFQPLGNGQYVMNSDMALKGSELDPFIDQLLQNNIVFQAEHQHFYDFQPMVWFIHFRAVGAPLELARAVKKALDVTSTPFPQMMPSNPTTSLPAKQIGKILGGKPTIGSNGIVTVDIPRKEQITLGGVKISPYLNVVTSVVFQPLANSQDAAAAPDFSMIASEIQNVVGVMRGQGWDIGCLYNQEIAEQPQLYFSHQFKVGNALTLAQEIRKGLNQTNVSFGG